MQQLTIEHENTIETKKDRRESKGRVLAISRRMYRLRQNTDTFYVESESSDNNYYFVKFKPDVFNESFCSCKDNATRGLKCKHLFAIEFAIKWGTIKDIDKVPVVVNTAENAISTNQNTSNNMITVAVTNSEVLTKRRTTKSYLNDDYDF